MFFKQFYLGCLAHASYLIGSDGEACVVDPQRDIQHYLDEAKKNNLTIKYILETHLHADFVSGHSELAEKTGATIVISEKAGAKFSHLAVSDGQVIRVGKVSLKILETPGHTPESICILVENEDKKGEPAKLLTGDTLFIGDVGRPDLVGSQGLSQEEMAGKLYDSLHNKILVLDDATEVYPAHGAGSLCGKNLSTERSSTIGDQRKFNCALQHKSKSEFIKSLCNNLPEVPAYFPEAVKKNKEGALPLAELKRPQALSAQDFKEKLDGGYVAIDVRSPALYGADHVPGSINVGLGGQFATWTGTLVPLNSQIILIAENKDAVEEAIVRLARAGHEKVYGYLEGSIAAWKKVGYDCQKVEQINVQELKNRIDSEKGMQIIDVRRPGEYADGHVPSAINMPLSQLPNKLSQVNKKPITAVVCRSGYRSSVATGMLKSIGIETVINITGGTNAWVDSGFKVSKEESCQPA